jgi:hypothetical protein
VAVSLLSSAYARSSRRCQGQEQRKAHIARATDAECAAPSLIATITPSDGRVLPLAQVTHGIERQTKAAEDLCARTQSVGVFGPGCPVKTPCSVSEAAGCWMRTHGHRPKRRLADKGFTLKRVPAEQ